jgi:hypothetical protein
VPDHLAQHRALRKKVSLLRADAGRLIDRLEVIDLGLEVRDLLSRARVQEDAGVGAGDEVRLAQRSVFGDERVGFGGYLCL